MELKKSPRPQAAKEKIRNALMYLLRRKKFGEIFVKDICTVACLHRSSFYEHYDDINDLMIKTENYFSERTAEIFEGCDPFDRQSFVAFFEFIGEHSDFYNAYLNYGEERNMGRTDFTKYLKSDKSADYEKDAAFHMAFFAGGLQAICNVWILTGMKKTPEQMADVILDEYILGAKLISEKK